MTEYGGNPSLPTRRQGASWRCRTSPLASESADPDGIVFGVQLRPVNDQAKFAHDLIGIDACLAKPDVAFIASCVRSFDVYAAIGAVVVNPKEHRRFHPALCAGHSSSQR